MGKYRHGSPKPDGNTNKFLTQKTKILYPYVLIFSYHTLLPSDNDTRFRFGLEGGEAGRSVVPREVSLS